MGAMGMAAGAVAVRPALLHALPAQTSRVAIGMCAEYDRKVTDVLSTMFNQLGGLQKLVNGKTVAIKLNLTGPPTGNTLNNMPLELAQWVHPQVIGSLITLLDQAGAKRIRLLESAQWRHGTDPLQDFMAAAGWKPANFVSAATNAKVEFENTNFLGSGKTYARMMVPGGGLMYTGYDLNHSYKDCDVYVSLAKLKEHRTAGVTLSMKNSFGITPATIYGIDAGVDEPSLAAATDRGSVHDGTRAPSKSAPPPVLGVTKWSRDAGYRMPRVVAELAAARPIHLAVIDGIYSLEGGELPGQGRKMLHNAVHPGVLIAGYNCVSTDAVGTAVMGFDPMAERGTAPFERCDNTMALAEGLGLGTRDLAKIEVLGTPIAKAKTHYKTLTELTKA
jgi:uncharacterized protein (DUF362 family)